MTNGNMLVQPDSLTSQTIEWLRFPLAILVVLLHAGAVGMNSNLEVYHTLSVLTTGGVCRIAVPCFFLISGYLFFRDMKEWNKARWKEKLIRRIHSLFIPYIIWNLIAFAAFFIYSYVRAKLGSLDLSFFEEEKAVYFSPDFWHILWDWYDGMPIDYPLWFVRDLILFTICTPLIYLFWKYLKVYGLLILAIILFIPLSVGKGILFYSFGAWIGINGRDLTESFYPYRWVALLVTIFVLTLLPNYYQRQDGLLSIFQNVFLVSGCICVISFASVGVSKGILTFSPFLVRSSFFIFASHGILILDDFAKYLMMRITPCRSELFYCCDLFIRPIIAVIMSLSLYFTLNRWTPSLLRVLTGSR